MSTPRLSRAVARAVATHAEASVIAPDDRLLGLPEKAVQFGTGAFLRGFVGHLVDEANRRGLFGGRIVAVASTGSGRDDALREQEGLFTVATEFADNGQDVREYRIVSAWSRALSAHSEWAAVLEMARNPAIELVLSNTTEVGIRLDESDAPDLVPPRSFPGKLTRFLLERGRAFGFAPERGVVVLPCELIEDNGDRLKEIVLALAARWETEPAFARWIEEAVPFCNTLVDRIVPGAPTGTNRARLRDLLGYDDALLTTTEPYSLFAVEWRAHEHAAALRPCLRFLEAGEQNVIVDDVRPYRERKVRLLNGAHSAMAPIGLLLGCETVRDAVQNPVLGSFVRRTMLEEIAPVVDAEGAPAFAEQVLERFRNRFIRHALLDITLQGTMKMRVRLIPVIERYLERFGQVPPSLAFALAAWLFFMRGDLQLARASGGLPVPADDHASRLRGVWAEHAEREEVGQLVWSVFGDEAIWGKRLTAHPELCEAIADHLWRIRTEGVRAALDHHLADAARAESVHHLSAIS